MMNPVIRREAQTTLRNWKMYAAITIYVALVALVAGVLIWGFLFNSYNYGFDPSSVIQMYVVLSAFQLGLVLITTPALTAGSISGERERQTLDLLLITKMSAVSIVIGKLLSSMGIIVLMTAATMPIFAIMFYFGGVSISSLFVMTGFFLSVSLFVGAVSIFLSSMFKRTAVSMVLVYCIIGFLCGGTLIILVVYNAFYYNFNYAYPSFYANVAIISLNPAVGFLSLIDSQIGTSLSAEILRYYYYYGYGTIVPTVITHFWVVNIGANLVLTGVFVFLSSKKLKKASKK